MTKPRQLPRCLPVADWPDADRTAWANAKLNGDIFDGSGAASHWRPATRRLVEQHVGRFLGWLEDEQGLKPTSVPESTKREVIRRYVVWLQPRAAPHTVLGHIRDLHEYLRVVWPDSGRSHIQNAERALAWKATATKNKRPRLKPTSELVALGEELMTRAQNDGRATDPRLPLAQFRDGLAIALLALRPLRIRAFGSILLGAHLQQVGDDWMIAIPPELSKNHRPMEVGVPASLVPALITYLETVRPRLLKLRGRWHSEPGRALWISIDGSAMKPKALGEAITKRTGEAFDHPISPHYFRDCAATTLAYDRPENVRLATPLLGHANPKMTEKHYIQSDQINAGRKLNSAMSELRSRLR